MDDQLFEKKNENELETLIQTIRILSQVIGMAFRIENVPCYNEKPKKH